MTEAQPVAIDMIVAVEGPSAAGKTTWAEQHGAGRLVPETGALEPPDGIGVTELAEFWCEINARRWADAIRIEAEHGIAVCDTDPLKLHYDYCLARIGHAPWERFDAGIAAVAVAMKEQRLGVVDTVVLLIPDDDTLDRQMQGDPRRRRRNFGLHRRLAEPLRDWYSALERAEPGRVLWERPRSLPTPVERNRYDTELFRKWMTALPRP